MPTTFAAHIRGTLSLPGSCVTTESSESEEVLGGEFTNW